MDDTDNAIEVLRLQLTRIELAVEIIRETIERLEPQIQPEPRNAANRSPHPAEPHNGPTDRDGNPIVIGYCVQFLMRGRHRSTSGTVTRFSRNNERVFSTDSSGTEVARAPRNLRVINVPVHVQHVQ